MALEVLTIELLGASFTVQTDESREYMDGLVSELERRFDALRSATRVTEPLKLSILAGITILDELVRLRGKAGEAEELGRLAERLIGRLDAGLDLPAEPPGPIPS